MPDEPNENALADLFEQLRRVRSGPREAYDTDDVIGILHLLARGYNVAEIERRTLVNRGTIMRWRNAFVDGYIQDLYPDIRERAAKFNVSLLPPQKISRVRPMLQWQQTAPPLEDRQNPYTVNGNGNGHMLDND